MVDIDWLIPGEFFVMIFEFLLAFASLLPLILPVWSLTIIFVLETTEILY